LNPKSRHLVFWKIVGIGLYFYFRVSFCISIPILMRIPYPRRRNGTWMKSKMTAAAILNFGKMAFLVTWSNSGCHFVQTHKIWAKPLIPGRIYGYFSKNRRRRPSAILEL